MIVLNQLKETRFVAKKKKIRLIEISVPVYRTQKPVRLTVKTCFSHYITGVTALNIPAPDGTTGDWRFSDILNAAAAEDGSVNEQFVIAGKTIRCTKKYFGNKGIYDCRYRLVQAGIRPSDEQPVYAADHVRAIADLVLHAVLADLPFEKTLNLNDWLAEQKHRWEFAQLMDDTCKKLEPDQSAKIQNWMKSFINNNNQRRIHYNNGMAYRKPCRKDRGSTTFQWNSAARSHCTCSK